MPISKINLNTNSDAAPENKNHGPKHLCNKFYVFYVINNIFHCKATFFNLYLMLFSLNTVMTLNYLLGVISSKT